MSGFDVNSVVTSKMIALSQFRILLLDSAIFVSVVTVNNLFTA